MARRADDDLWHFQKAASDGAEMTLKQVILHKWDTNPAVDAVPLSEVDSVAGTTAFGRQDDNDGGHDDDDDASWLSTVTLPWWHQWKCSVDLFVSFDMVLTTAMMD